VTVPVVAAKTDQVRGNSDADGKCNGFATCQIDQIDLAPAESSG
jgi:hypothetical protein